MGRKFGSGMIVLITVLAGLGCQAPPAPRQHTAQFRGPYGSGPYSTASEYASLANSAPVTQASAARYARQTAPAARPAVSSSRPTFGASCFS
jgi:hypothetical protein